MTKAIIERRQLGNQEKLYLRMRNSKSALDSISHSLESKKLRKLHTGLHLLRRKQQLIRLKLKQLLKPKLKLKLLKKQKLPLMKQKLLLKLRLLKPKLKKKPKMPSQLKHLKTFSSTLLRNNYQNLKSLSKLHSQWRKPNQLFTTWPK